jgi:hypothetical protein
VDRETTLSNPMTDESLDDRVPCSDDMCVGIIGENGRCGICGKPGTPPPRLHPEHPHDDLHQTSTAPAPPSEAEEPGEDAEDDDEDEDEETTGDDERVPCLDDMCVGILSTERKCGTCGKTWPLPRPG